MQPGIAIVSGKGGVGKTLISVNFALALSMQRHVGIIDLDILNPNLTYAMGIPDDRATLIEKGMVMLPYRYNDMIEILSPGHYFYDVKGHTEIAITEQGISDYVRMAFMFTKWNAEVFVIDTDPSSRQVIPALQSVLKRRLYALMVMENSIPAIADAERMYDKLFKRGIPVIGIIANRTFGDMTLINAFAHSNDLRVIGNIPFDSEIARQVAGGNAILPNGYSSIVRDIGDLIWQTVRT